MERRGYVLHSSNGRYSDKPVAVKPTFFGKTDWGRLNYRITTHPSVGYSDHQVTYLGSELPPQFGNGHRFQLDPSSIRPATGDDMRSWYMAGTPFDFMGGSLGDVKVHGLISFTFNLIIPPASIVWEKRVERNDDDVAKHLLFSTPYKYTMRHRFLTAYYPGA